MSGSAHAPRRAAAHVPRRLGTSKAGEPLLAQDVEVADAVAGKGEGPRGDTESPRHIDTGANLARRRLARATPVAEDHVREAMAPDLLLDPGVEQPLHEAASVEDGIVLL